MLLGGGQIGEADGKGGAGGEEQRDGLPYPPHTPIAIIERASMPDQRVVASTLRDVVRAMERGRATPTWNDGPWVGSVGALGERGRECIGSGFGCGTGEGLRVRRWMGDGGWSV